MSKLAVLGGSRAVPEGTIGKWPPIDDIDRKMVLDSLEGGSHSFGPNCSKFTEEFAQHIQSLGRLVEVIDRHVPYLSRKAEIIEEYLQTKCSIHSKLIIIVCILV